MKNNKMKLDNKKCITNELNYEFISDWHNIENCGFDIYVDDKLLDDILKSKVNSTDIFKNLWVISSIDFDFLKQSDREYILNLIDNKVDCNYPIMIDINNKKLLDNTIIMKINYSKDFVFWKSFGLLKKLQGNSIHEILNNDDNIQWLGDLNFKFDINKYFKLLKEIKEEIEYRSSFWIETYKMFHKGEF